MHVLCSMHIQRFRSCTFLINVPYGICLCLTLSMFSVSCAHTVVQGMNISHGCTPLGVYEIDTSTLFVTFVVAAPTISNIYTHERRFEVSASVSCGVA